MINWEWDIVNIIGLTGIILEGCALFYIAYRLAARERNSRISSNQNTNITEACPENKQYYPKYPHWIVPPIMHKVIYYITSNKTYNNCYEILHKLISIITGKQPNANKTVFTIYMIHEQVCNP